MGFCFSCCRRRKSPEREPLLPKDHADFKPPPYNEIFANIVAAINAGKLPSQAQLDHACRIALNSNILNVEHDQFSRSKPLSDNLRQIVKDIREVLEALVEVGLQKNSDDKIQNVIFLSKDVSYQSAHPSISLEVLGAEDETGNLSNAALNFPSTTEVETDSKLLADSVIKLLRLFLTSSAFRILLQDVLVSMREIIAGTAATVSLAAGQVQVAAEKIERMVEPGNDVAPTPENITSAVDVAQQTSKDAFADLQHATVDETRTEAIHRIQNVVTQATKSPEYREAIQTIILVFRKYREHLNEIASVAKEGVANTDKVELRIEPQLWVDENLAIVVADIKSLLERFASGHSLDTIFHLFNAFMDDMSSSLFDPGLESYFSDIGKWFNRSLSDSGYAASPVGTKAAEDLYDRGRAFTVADTKFGKDIRTLFKEFDSLLDALQHDKSSQRMLVSSDKLSCDFACLFRNQPDRLIEELKQDVIGWFLPRILRTLHTIPMPRIEFVSDTFEIALDALFLATTSTASSLMPDHIRLENRNELRIDMNEGTIRKNRVCIHVDGLRFAAKHLGYYVRYKGNFLGYVDEGLLSVFVGEGIGEGLTFDVDLELDVDVTDHDIEALFRTQDVQASVTGLRFSINQSKHWILNKLIVQPFAGPIVRRVFKHFVSRYIQTGLDAAARFATNVQKDVNASVQGDSSPAFEDYWAAILRQSETDPTPRPTSPDATVHTQATLKGIIRTTQENADPSVPHEPEETTLAVGIGPQILPDKGLVALEENATQIARDAVDEVEDTIDNVKGKAREFTNGVDRSTANDTVERITERAKVERRSGGWRSSAFDLW